MRTIMARTFHLFSCVVCNDLIGFIRSFLFVLMEGLIVSTLLGFSINLAHDNGYQRKHNRRTLVGGLHLLWRLKNENQWVSGEFAYRGFRCYFTTKVTAHCCMILVCEQYYF